MEQNCMLYSRLQSKLIDSKPTVAANQENSYI